MDRTLTIKFDPRAIITLGAVLVMIAAWLPWSSLPSFLVGDLARRGLSLGGLITFAIALLAALSLLLPWRPLRRVSLVAAILAMLIDLIALVAFARIVQFSTGMEMALGTQLGNVGSGLFLTFAGTWLMILGGLADAAPVPGHNWLSLAAWSALIGLLLAACLCAWSVGLIVRPLTVTAPTTPVATFGPAPTTYLSTPLVDVQLAPLGSSNAPPTAAPAPTKPSAPTATRQNQPSVPSPTVQRSAPTSTPTRPPSIVPTSTALPTIGARTSTPTMTASPTPSATPTVTPTQFTSPIGTSTTTPTPTAES